MDDPKDEGDDGGFNAQDEDEAEDEATMIDFFAPLPAGIGFSASRDAEAGSLVMTAPWFYESPAPAIIAAASSCRMNGRGSKTRVKRH